MLSIRLFHGRSSPDEALSDWGFDGPTLGPFTHVSMTYGCINVSTDDEVFDLTIVDGLVVYDGKFYGDVSITTGHEPMRRIPRVPRDHHRLPRCHSRTLRRRRCNVSHHRALERRRAALIRP